MVATEEALIDIALGEASPAQALAALSSAFGSGDPHAAQDAYVALRSWVWKALDARRRDQDLRAWFDVVRRTSSFLRARDSALAERVATLQELLQESISASERLIPDEVLRNKRARDIVAMLASAPGGELARAVIGEGIGLEAGNLTRVLNMLVHSGLATKTCDGAGTSYRIAAATLGAVEGQAFDRDQGAATVAADACSLRD